MSTLNVTDVDKTQTQLKSGHILEKKSGWPTFAEIAPESLTKRPESPDLSPPIVRPYMLTCRIYKCEKAPHTREMCSAHYQAYMRERRKMGKVKRRTRKKLCTVANCGGKHVAKGYCSKHYWDLVNKKRYEAKHGKREKQPTNYLLRSFLDARYRLIDLETNQVVRVSDEAAELLFAISKKTTTLIATGS